MATGNVQRAAAEFRGYLTEIPTCSMARREEIARDVHVTTDLMNCSPAHLWDSDDFLALDRLVTDVAVALRQK